MPESEGGQQAAPLLFLIIARKAGKDNGICTAAEQIPERAVFADSECYNDMGPTDAGISGSCNL